MLEPLEGLLNTPPAVIERGELRRWMRIPRTLDSDSTATWTPIPRQTGQSERSDAGLKGFTLSLVLGSNFPLGGNDAIVF
jgi:hypothetical protein